MSNTPDLSKIVGLIMENPELIAQIKNLSGIVSDVPEDKNADADTEKTEAPKISDTAKAAESVSTSAPTYDEGLHSKKRRRELLCALKPFVSKSRSSAIDTMLTLSDVLDVIKER